MNLKESPFDTSKFTLTDVIADEQLFHSYWHEMRQKYHDKAVRDKPYFLAQIDINTAKKDFYFEKLSERAQKEFELLTSNEPFNAFKESKNARDYWTYVNKNIDAIFENQPTADQLRQMSDTELRQIQHERGVVVFGGVVMLGKYINTVKDTRAVRWAGDISPKYWNEVGDMSGILLALQPNYYIGDYDKYEKLAYLLSDSPHIHMEIPEAPENKPRRRV